MSRNLQDQKRRYEERRLPEPRMSSAHVSDPAYYDSRTANNNGWHVQRPFDELQPYEGEDRPDYLESPTLRPMRSLHPPQGSRRPTTPLGDRNTERSVQNTRHFSRSEERASEHHAPRDHESRETRRSEASRETRRSGRSSGNSGMGGKNPTTNKHSRDLFANSILQYSQETIPNTQTLLERG